MLFSRKRRAEIAHILRSIANKIDDSINDDIKMYQTIFDINGNDVGRYAIKETENT